MLIVAGWATHLKTTCQNESMPQGVKIQNSWNHHLQVEITTFTVDWILVNLVRSAKTPPVQGWHDAVLAWPWLRFLLFQGKFQQFSWWNKSAVSLKTNKSCHVFQQICHDFFPKWTSGIVNNRNQRVRCVGMNSLWLTHSPSVDANWTHDASIWTTYWLTKTFQLENLHLEVFLGNH